MAYIRLTDPAIEDLRRIYRRDPSILKVIFRKILLLELNPLAGEPLLGELIGWRKLTVGDRHWRIIWRSTLDKLGEIEIEIAQVWAIGARSDSQIYDEIRERIKVSPLSPAGTALAEVLALFSEKVSDVTAQSEPVDQPAPEWLLNRLVHSVGLTKEEIRGLSVDQAMEIWDEFIRQSEN